LYLKIAPVGTNWVVTTLAGLAGTQGLNDGTGSTARFGSPYGLALDSATNIYVADLDVFTIRKIAPVGTNWVVTTLTGLNNSLGSSGGTGSTAQLARPAGVAVDSATNIYVSSIYDLTFPISFHARDRRGWFS
jgi:hypothetical protein